VPFALPRSRALVPLLVTLVALSTATRAGAQQVLGYGEDATAAPVGAIRARFSIDWHRSSLLDAANDTTYDNDRQVRITNLGLEVGVLKRFSIGANVPWVVTKTLTFVSSPHTVTFTRHDSVLVEQRQVLDTLLDSSHNGWGNIEAFGTIVWLGEPGQQGRLAFRDGVHIRSAITGGALLGTGIMLRPSDRFGIPTSDREKAIVARSATDVMVGAHFFGTIVARYEKPFSDDVYVGMHPGDNPFADDAVAVFAHRQLGARYEIEFTPRYQVGRYFAVGAQYRYHHGAQDSYTGTTTSTVNNEPVTLDASTLNAGTELTEHRVGFGVVYSAVDAYTRNQSRLPMEVTFEHTKVVSTSNDRPKDSNWTFSVRIFKRLWGAEFAPPARTKTAPTLEPEPAPPSAPPAPPAR
jgi:hypothetical protein